nr:ribonuclease E [Gloiopeltis furcata]
MVKKIVISRFNNIAAVLQKNKIQELITINNSYQVNDIYIGIVAKVFSSINAAFIKLSETKKSGFIHISDIKPLKKRRNTHHIKEVLSVNQLILVQIIKEPTKNKGPRLTANISITGKYIVLMPFCNTICISNKIHDRNERTYLHSLALLIKPSTMGILVRSAARGVPNNIIINDLGRLKDQWSFIEKLAIHTNSPQLIYKEKDLVQKVIRDYYEKDVENIIIDSKDGLRQIKYHLQKWECITPKTQVKLQLYNKPECILEEFHIKQAVLKALQPKIKLASGGYIVIESNEAFTVIDVNSGSFNKSNNCNETILRINFYAAIEIAYQLKIRNINGIIIIDFIDMQSKKDQLQLLEHFSHLLNSDDARPRIVQLSELGLMELTRRRRGQSLSELVNSRTHAYLNANKNINVKHKEQKDTLAIHRNIRSLFFNRTFNKTINLKTKEFVSNIALQNSYYISLDRSNTVNLLDPCQSYIIPLVLYFKAIKVLE